MATAETKRYRRVMPTKTYGQVCPMARALDVLGERWTVLVVRELLLGPKRFKHLLAALPAIGANRLADRLKALDEAGIVRKGTLPAPAGVPVYELTDDGERLREPLIALGLWGLDLPMDDRIDPQSARAELIALCLTGTQTKPLESGRRDTLEFHVGDEVFHFQLRHGWFLPRSGPSPSDPDLRIDCDLQTFMELALRSVTPAQAIKQNRVAIRSGTRQLMDELFRVLAYVPRAPLLRRT
ncbi:winged helix-turn-helix transcriptional regulator [Smaragdicoccus niigatensis]